MRILFIILTYSILQSNSLFINYGINTYLDVGQNMLIHNDIGELINNKGSEIKCYKSSIILEYHHSIYSKNKLAIDIGFLNSIKSSILNDGSEISISFDKKAIFLVWKYNIFRKIDIFLKHGVHEVEQEDIGSSMDSIIEGEFYSIGLYYNITNYEFYYIKHDINIYFATE